MSFRIKHIIIAAVCLTSMIATAQNADSIQWQPSVICAHPAAFSLHDGLNINVGTSVFAGWGGKHYRGTGFTQDIDLTYVSRLSPKTTLAVGAYVDNTLWRGSNYTVAGIRALLNYQIDDHWSAYAFVQKAATSGNIRHLGAYGYGYYPSLGFYGYDGLSYGGRFGGGSRYMDRVGAGLRYEWGKWNQNSIQIQVEMDRMPQHSHGYDLQRYDYPVR